MARAGTHTGIDQRALDSQTGLESLQSGHPVTLFDLVAEYMYRVWNAFQRFHYRQLEISRTRRAKAAGQTTPTRPVCRGTCRCADSLRSCLWSSLSAIVLSLSGCSSRVSAYASLSARPNSAPTALDAPAEECAILIVVTFCPCCQPLCVSPLMTLTILALCLETTGAILSWRFPRNTNGSMLRPPPAMGSRRPKTTVLLAGVC